MAYTLNLTTLDHNIPGGKTYQIIEEMFADAIAHKWNEKTYAEFHMTMSDCMDFSNNEEMQDALAIEGFYTIAIPEDKCLNADNGLIAIGMNLDTGVAKVG